MSYAGKVYTFKLALLICREEQMRWPWPPALLINNLPPQVRRPMRGGGPRCAR